MCQVHQGRASRENVFLFDFESLSISFSTQSQSRSPSLVIPPSSLYSFSLLSPPTLGLVFMFSAIAPLSFKQSCTVIYFAAFVSTRPLHTSVFPQPTYEVVAHAQVIVPHGDLQGFLCQLVQGYVI